MTVLLSCSLRVFILRAFIMFVLVSVGNQGLAQSISSQDDFQLSGQVLLDADHYGVFFSEDEKKRKSTRRYCRPERIRYTARRSCGDFH